MWKDIKGYEGIYRINQAGEVLSVKRNIIKKLDMQRAGYWQLNLTKNKKSTSYFLHRLIAETFIPNPHQKPQVNHKNGNRIDNRIENLEWAEAHENSKHRFRNHKKRKITMDELQEIYLKTRSKSLSEVSKEYNIPQSALWNILSYIHPDY